MSLVPKTDLPREMLLHLANEMGIGAEVAAVLAEKETQGKYGLRNMTLGRLMNATSATLRVTKTSLAKKSGISDSQFYAYGREPQTNMRLPRIVQIARAMNVHWLVVACTVMRANDWLPAPGAQPVARHRIRKARAPETPPIP